MISLKLKSVVLFLLKYESNNLFYRFEDVLMKYVSKQLALSDSFFWNKK